MMSYYFVYVLNDCKWCQNRWGKIDKRKSNRKDKIETFMMVYDEKNFIEIQAEKNGTTCNCMSEKLNLNGNSYRVFCKH